MSRQGIGIGVLLLTVVLLAAAPLCADNFWMDASELRTSFSDATINGEYVDGRLFVETYKASGALAYTETTNNRHWTGHWSIVRDRFCTIYDGAGTGGCYRVRHTSENCFEFFFDTRTEEEARLSTLRIPTWTARAWRTDRASTCKQRPMV